MIKYILKRIVQVIPVLLGVSIIVFLMLSLSPGDPARLALGMNAKPEQIEAFNHENGLDQPVLVQYVNYMKGLVTGNLGVSYTTKQSVAKMIAVRLPATCILAFGSLVLTYLIAIPLGILLAVKQNTFFDDAFRVVALIVSSIPAFWLGLLLMLLFSVKLGILPSNGFDTPLHWILPLLCSCFGTWAGSSRYIRAMVLDTIRQDYVRTARAKGLPERVVIYKHALKNGMIPIVTFVGGALPSLFAGAMITETLFQIPGIGYTSARRIIGARRTHSLEFADLKRIGVVLKRALYFITCNGRMMYNTRLEESYITRNLLDEENCRKHENEAAFQQLSLFGDEMGSRRLYTENTKNHVDRKVGAI